MSVIYYLQSSPTALLLTTGILGLLIGSFLNVVIHRLPIIMERDWKQQCRELTTADQPEGDETEPYNLIVPRSRCPACNHPISVLENIPIISYLILRGRCSACDAPISIRYPSIELLCAILSVAVIWQFGLNWQGAGALLLTWSLISLGFIDLDTFLLPDSITLPLLWCGLCINLFGIYAPLQDAVIGAIAGYGSLWLVYQLFKLVTGKEGMGFGDFKLLAMLGAWMGWQLLPVIVLLSSLVGAVIGISLILIRGRDRNIPIPFGPYLAIAGWIALQWGHDITASYLNWSGY